MLNIIIVPNFIFVFKIAVWDKNVKINSKYMRGRQEKRERKDTGEED